MYKRLKRNIMLLMGILWLLYPQVCIQPVLAASANEGETNTLYVDADGNFIFKSYDKRKTSSIYYRTVGFTISRCIKGERREHATAACITIPLNDPEKAALVTSEINGYILSEWTITSGTILSLIQLVDMDWYNEIMDATENGEGYWLKADAIMITYENEKASGFLYPNAETSGSTYWKSTIHTVRQDTIPWDPALLDAYPWRDKTKIKNHYDKYIFFPGKLEPEEPDLETSDAPSDEIFTKIGRDLTKAYTNGESPGFNLTQEGIHNVMAAGDKSLFYTYNWSDIFHIGKNIPTSEEITNGFGVRSWFGTVTIGKRTVIRKYRFHTVIKWSDYQTNTWQEWNPVTEEYETRSETTRRDYSENYDYTVERSGTYFYIWDMDLWDYSDAVVSNRVYPGGSKGYASLADTQYEIIKDDIVNPESAPASWVPEDGRHITWPASPDYNIVAEGGDRENAKANARAMAESRVGNVTVKNDKVAVNGTVYLSNTSVTGKNPIGDSMEFTGANAQKMAEDIVKSDNWQESTDSGIIPGSIPNGSYDTSLLVRFRQALYRQKQSMIRTELVLKNGYEQFEPIWVNTPAYSPAEIVGGEETTGQNSFTGGSAGKENAAANVDYHFRLDGTYTLKISPEKMAEKLSGMSEEAKQRFYASHNPYYDGAYDEGYGSPAYFDKYMAFRQVKFPFDIEAEGEYIKAGTWMELNEEEIDFTIEAWAESGLYAQGATNADTEEGNCIVIRTAPENVVDEDGVNHINDKEFLMNNGVEDYVAVYKMTCELSGWIYNFQVVGLNDKDMLLGINKIPWYDDKNLALCPLYLEKKDGNKNRVGESKVRFTVDGSLTEELSDKNLLPFSKGDSSAFPAMGTLAKGTRFQFTIKTLANLFHEPGAEGEYHGSDYVYITPSYRYYDKNGEKEEEPVFYYYRKADGTYVELSRDLEKQKVRIGDQGFTGSFYTGHETRNQGTVSDAQDTVKYHNKWTGDEQTVKRRLQKETESYTLGHIKLTDELRFLTGNLEQLKKNLGKEPAATTNYATKSTVAAESGYERVDYGDELKEKFRISMQTWFGEYYVPSDICVSRLSPEELGRLDFITSQTQTEDPDSPWLSDTGYLVLNFDIRTYSEGYDNLKYYGTNDGEGNQWKKEGGPGVLEKDNGVTADDGTKLPTKSGDVAVIELNRRVEDGRKPRIYMIN